MNLMMTSLMMTKKKAKTKNNHRLICDFEGFAYADPFFVSIIDKGWIYEKRRDS